MTFVRRFTEVPPLEVITQIEGIVIVDETPPAQVVGAGTGALLVVGEFEDGPFAADAGGVAEVFTPDGLLSTYGSFGYKYGSRVSQNPCARRHGGELWNGNGFIKMVRLRCQRLFMARVDTSVGSVAFSPIAGIAAKAGPFVLAVGQQLSITTDIGGPALSAALTATKALNAGAAGVFPTLFVGGETVGFTVDGGQQVNVVFSAADQTAAQCAARINAALGYTCAVVNAGELDFSNVIQGSSARLVLAAVTPGALTTLGHAAGSTSGTGNVANILSVTATEIATIVNATVALNAIDAKAQIQQDGTLLFVSTTPSAGTVEVTATTMSAAIGVALTGAVVAAATHAAGSVPAGTRVSDGAHQWVTMQTLDIPANAAGPWPAKVRPAVDDGTAAGAAALSVTQVIDQPAFSAVSANNAGALAAALTEPQMDNAYSAAFDATLNASLPSKAANYTLSARRTDMVVRAGRQNALDATANGLTARKFVTGDPLGTTTAQILANVALFRSDRVFYAGKGLKVNVPEISAVGSAGGLGFTDDGVITVRPDGPLATVCCMIPPEDNPGEATGLIDGFFEVDDFGETLTIDSYKAFKSAGVAVPIIDAQDGTTFQSGVTSSLTPGRITMARRRMADFIQDTFARLLPPFSKKLNKRSRRDSIRAVIDQFLGDLESSSQPELQRIESFAVDDGAGAGNTAAKTALGVHFIKSKVRTLSSLDEIVMVTEIGEGVITTTEATP